MACKTVFVVSDDSAIRDSLAETLAAAGLHAETHSSLDAWLGAVRPERQGCLVLDARRYDFAGPERLAQFASICEGRPVLLLIDRGDVPAAVRAIRDGAVEVVEKPYRDENLVALIRRASVAAQDAHARK